MATLTHATVTLDAARAGLDAAVRACAAAGATQQQIADVTGWSRARVRRTAETKGQQQ